MNFQIICHFREGWNWQRYRHRYKRSEYMCVALLQRESGLHKKFETFMTYKSETISAAFVIGLMM